MSSEQKVTVCVEAYITIDKADVDDPESIARAISRHLSRSTDNGFGTSYGELISIEEVVDGDIDVSELTEVM